MLTVSLRASLGMLVLFLREMSYCVHAIAAYALDTGDQQSLGFCAGNVIGLAPLY